VMTRTLSRSPGSAGVWCDAQDRLWLAWSDGTTVRVERLESVDHIADETAWKVIDTIDADHLGGGALIPGGESLMLATLDTPTGRINLIETGGTCQHVTAVHTHPLNHSPSLALTPDGTCTHLVWDTEDLFIRHTAVMIEDLRDNTSVSTEPKQVWSGCHHPDVACNGEHVVVTYTGHMQNIKYGWFDGAEWHLDRHLTTLHPRFSETLEHSPWLWTDNEGVLHLSFVCLTRRLAFDSRWLGEGFSDPQPAEGLMHPSLFLDEVRVRPERLSLDRKGGTMLLSSSFLPERHGVYRQSAPSSRIEPDEPLLFLDLEELAELSNGAPQLETMRLDPVGPVLEPTGNLDDFDSSRVLSGGTVIRDDGRYRMWYGALGLTPEAGIPWYEQVYVGYAESGDGINWRRVDTGNGDTYKGRPAPNRIRNVDHNACVFVDPADDRSRRYKAIKFESRAQRHDHVLREGEGSYLGLPRRAWLSTSPDGLTWKREQVSVDFPGPEPYGFQPQSAIHDPRDPDPARRYKAIGFTSLAGRRRGASLAYSPDARHWVCAERHPLLDSLMAVNPIRGAGPYGQIHDAGIARHGRYLLAFYQYQHDGSSADIRLAFSRDNQRFRFTQPETPLVALGKPGSWNSAYLMTSSFVADGDTMSVYFGANSDQPHETVHGLPILHMCAGRAVAKRDRFVRLAPLREGRSMTAETVPLTLERHGPITLQVNAKLSPTARLRVALLEETGEWEIPGLGLEDCQPITGDSLAHTVVWGETRYLRRAISRFRVRFALDGTAEDGVYALTFVSTARIP
ncbi:MAG: hypothetical protein HON70_18255, partial [Lentisphaerae bacterium]|nr:hypothetical protein [Lentisphaerota bacterium]